MSEIAWRPDPEAARGSTMARFAEAQGIDPFDYETLHRWSIADPGAFWSAVWDWAEVIGVKGDRAFVPDESAWMTGARFFPDAEVNLAENFLRATGDAEAVVETDEAGNRAALTADELRAEVARVARGLRAAGVGPGDRVGTVLPNRIPALVSLLATAAVGGVWTSCSPDFGPEGILDRIGQVRPKVLIVEPRYRYGGKAHDISERITEVAGGMPDLERVVVIGGGDVSAAVPVERWGEFGAPSELTFTRVPFDAPVYILYTSGTTGAPKAIVHRTGGVLVQQLKEHMLHGDVRKGDRAMWYTNTAWMMYHWIVATLGRAATVVLYDGAPILKAADGLDGTPLWRVAEAERLTHLGVSPKYMATLADAGFVPKAGRDLGALRWLMSAGSPVAPQQVDWIYANIGDHLGFASISGGTELLGCFLLGAPMRPVRRGTLTAKGLGMAVNVLDERGAPVIGRAGELVCTEPFPSMPLTFWGENGDRRYRDTYFSTYAEIWAHGDHATLNVDGTAVIHGRSDTTLNPGGVRIGTADIYNVCDRFAEIEDCIVFGRPVPGDEEIVLCIKPSAGAAVDAALAQRLRDEIRAECSPRHVPSAIYEVPDIPYTLNGKRVEKAAQALATGGEVKNKGAIANLESLEAFGRLSASTPL